MQTIDYRLTSTDAPHRSQSASVDPAQSVLPFSTSPGTLPFLGAHDAAGTYVDAGTNRRTACSTRKQPEVSTVRFPLSRLWPFILRPPAKPAIEDPGPVDAIVRLLKNEQVVEVADRSKPGANGAAVSSQ
jgi:hypothetical protein